MKNYIYLIFLLFMTNACASIVDGSMQEMTFNSEPEGVEVSTNGMVLGKTPLTTLLKRKKQRIIEFTLTGHKKQTRVLETGINPWFWGNALFFGGFYSSTTDVVTRSIHEYEPNHHYATMVADSSTSINRVVSEKAKIKEYIMISYNQIISDIAKGQGQYLDTLVSMLGIEDSNRSDSIKKITSLSEVYTIIPEFAEHVISYFLKK